ncbi:MAG: trypsin-like serine protease [Planctomycetes bacterium]|nr:trypsin-like serine protease [Planctomycetota bacterium]
MKGFGAVAIALNAALAAQAGTLPKATVDRVAAACVLIQAIEGKEGSAGSGFFVGRNEVLTNYHVVKNAAEGGAKVTLVMGTDPRTRKLANADVVAGDETLDLALLRTDQPSANVLRFAAERSLALTQQVWVAGFPFGTKPGLEVTLTAGTISALRHDDATGALRQVQLDAAVNPGNSGGPVVDDKGNVAAVTVATVKPAVGSGMALAIPCGAAEGFLKVARQAKRRTARLQVAGRLPVRNVHIGGGEKAEEIWGTSVSFTLRSVRGTDELPTVTLEVTNRRHEVLARETVEVGTLAPREEKPVTVRLRRVAFDDVAACRIAE